MFPSWQRGRTVYCTEFEILWSLIKNLHPTTIWIFVLDGAEFTSATMLSKQPTGEPPIGWDSQQFMFYLKYHISLFIYSAPNQHNSAKCI